MDVLRRAVVAARAGTDPASPASRFEFTGAGPDGDGILVRWRGALGRAYTVEWAEGIETGFTPLAGGIPGQGSETAFDPTLPASASQMFFRIRAGP
jgi:hypothetical protein